MPIAEKVIRDAVARYDRERDRYLKLAARVSDICRSSIVEDNAIRAQVTFRTKTVRSFEGKLTRFARRPDKNYSSVDEVFAGVGDFAGVRIATYRPEDERRVTDEIRKLFEGEASAAVFVDKKDKLAVNSYQFYRATHCQVFLREDDLVGHYENLRGTSCEIQVCSMMAHVWNEIEHDIGYKPEGGRPGEAEKGLLEALGHLTRSGDAAITRLLAANAARMQENVGDFVDVHDFVARVRPHFPEADLSVNAGQAFDEIVQQGLNSIPKLIASLGEEALKPAVAASRIEAFNRYLESIDSAEYALNPASADVVTVAILHKFAGAIVDRHPSERGKGRPARIFFVGRLYDRFLESLNTSERSAA
ncbi:GTP pyrophosphokinase family protein [Acidisphaera sp. S103]|uniref:GTP pyrophosphokinase n=1 Tax=Acidisphaera sp. S103 TaxID=1747223 RepID=UPI00131E67E8|nr:RelA/SpoT domain-containing protein [Acidisphaera sp. S103]